MVEEWKTIIQTAADRYCRTPGIGVIEERLCIGSAEMHTADQCMPKRGDALIGGITPDDTRGKSIGPVVIAVGMEAKLNLAADIFVEVVGSAEDRAGVHRPIRVRNGTAAAGWRVNRAMRREIGVPHENIDSGYGGRRGRRWWCRTLS